MYFRDCYLRTLLSPEPITPSLVGQQWDAPLHTSRLDTAVVLSRRYPRGRGSRDDKREVMCLERIPNEIVGRASPFRSKPDGQPTDSSR